MNILFLTRLYKPHVGGVEKHVEEITKILSKKHQVTIITEQHDKKIKGQEANVYRIPVWKTSEKRKKWLIWKWFIKNIHLIRQADIIHAHDVFFWLLPFRFMFPLKPIYTTFHGYEGPAPPRWQAIILRKISEILSEGSICVGEFMKKWYFANPNKIIYGAAQPTGTVPVGAARNNAAIFLGRLNHDTGIMEYLRLAKLMNLKLDVYGDGLLLGVAKQFVKKHKLKVKFKGFIPNAQQYIKNYQYAFVSRYLAILEAMQVKRTVVAQYNNQIKKDYLTCHPQFKNMVIFNQAKEVKLSNNKINNAHNWAKKQSWQKLSNIYLTLWQS